MPNYVKNRITFNSEKELRLAFSYLLGNLYKPELDEEELSNLFSFELIVPKPKTAEECEKKFGKEYLYTKDSHVQVDEDFPFLNWYEWQCKFWGCKWDASDISVYNSCIEFDTPWDAPIPVMEEICKVIPSVPFSWEFSEEQGLGGFAGIMIHNPTLLEDFSEVEEKKLTKVNIPEIQYYQEDSEIAEAYNSLWGETYYKAVNDGCYCGDWEIDCEGSGVLYDGYDYYHYDLETEEGCKEYEEKKKEIEGETNNE